MDRTSFDGFLAYTHAALRHRVGIDTRALAAFRISLGLLVVADIILRSLDLVAFYTDSGTLPRTALVDLYPGLAGLSIHAISGAPWVQGVLFIVTAAVAIALAAGYRTRFATIGSLLLVASLSLRNPVVLNAGDALLLHLLLWGAFLPLGRRWSIDALRTSTPDDDLVVSVASAAVILQVVVVYTVNAAFKFRYGVWLSGEALPRIFEIDRLTVLLGPLVARFPRLLVALDWLWVVMVVSSVLLILLTGRRRALFASLFIGAHMGMVLTLRLGLFPLISVAALLPFLPSEVWDILETRLTTTGLGPVAVTRARKWVGNRVRAVNGRRWGGGLFPPASTGVPQLVPSGTAAVLLVLILGWNAATLGYVDPPDTVESTVDPDQYRWDMFAAGGGDDGWFVVPGELESGKRTDVFHRRPVQWDRPPDIAATYPTHRWLVYLVKLSRPGYAAHRPYLAEHLCQSWNSEHQDELVRLTIYYVVEHPGDSASGGTDRRELLEHTCSPATRGL